MKRSHAIGSALLILIIMMSVVSLRAEELGIDVYSKTPLGTALRVLAEQTGCVITYEDPPYSCKDDIWRPDGTWNAPIGHPLTYTYDNNQDIKTIIQGLLDVYREQDYPGEFIVVESGDIYNVYPVSIRNRDCNLASYSSAFETQISITAKDQPASRVIKEAILAASKAYAQCEIHPLGSPWDQPFHNVVDWNFLQDIKDKSLRDVLNVFVRELNVMQKQQNEIYTWYSDYVCSQETPSSPTAGTVYEPPWHYISIDQFSLSSDHSMKTIVYGVRPTLIALDLLSKRLDLRVTYEDLPFAYIREYHPDKLEVLDGIVQLDWDRNWGIIKIMQELSHAEVKARALWDMFEIEKTTYGYHMFPVKTKTDWDTLECPTFKSVLSNEIIISDTSSDDLDLLKKVCNTISDVCGKEISIKTMDTQISSKLSDKSTMITRPTGTIKAHVYLDAIITAHCPEATWRLLYEPAEDKYVLDVYDRILHPYRSAQYMHGNK